MIVADASAIVELLLQTQLGRRVEERLHERDEDIHAPHLLDIEVVSALRRLVRRREVPLERAEQALEDLGFLRVTRHPHIDLVMPAWKLRDNFTAYDAMYLALADTLDAVVVTCDAPLGSAHAHGTRIEVIR